MQFQAGGSQGRRTCWFPEIVLLGSRLDPLVCAPFAEPQLSPFEAPVLWLLDVERAALPARVQHTWKPQLNTFRLPREVIRTHVHFDARNRQIIVLENEICRTTLIADGALITLGAVRLQIGWIDLSDLAASAHHLNALAHILLARRYHGPSRRPAAVDARHLSNAIIAHDGERAGAMRRQIASVIYGEAVVDNEWSDPAGRLKAMVKRDVLRGRRLVTSGWRDLLTVGMFTVQA